MDELVTVEFVYVRTSGKYVFDKKQLICYRSELSRVFSAKHLLTRLDPTKRGYKELMMQLYCDEEPIGIHSVSNLNDKYV